jgi:hypothetical protein
MNILARVSFSPALLPLFLFIWRIAKVIVPPNALTPLLEILKTLRINDANYEKEALTQFALINGVNAVMN